VPGLIGPLAHLVDADVTWASLVDLALGTLGQSLVVDSLDDLIHWQADWSATDESRTVLAAGGRIGFLSVQAVREGVPFAADASHQLRTPLTALRLKLERARDMVTKDPQGAEVRIAAAEAEADRLGNIIEGLLMLSRTEAQSAPIEVFDVANIARARIEHWQPLAAESAIKVRYEGPASALALAVPTAVEQIIDNFVDNALSIVPPKSTLTLRVAKSATTVELHVLDQGPGLSAEDCVRAFDRFWRAASDNKGSGLGLAIVAQLARASGAAAALTPRPEGGIDASVRFKAP
jgi:signal transduction histidine kinase